MNQEELLIRARDGDREAGEALIQACPAGGNIFAINGSPTDRNVDEVVRGFNKAIEGSNLNVVYTEYCDNWMAELAGNYVTQGLEVTKDIVGVMCGNDDLASQAVKVLSLIHISEPTRP